MKLSMLLPSLAMLAGAAAAHIIQALPAATSPDDGNSTDPSTRQLEEYKDLLYQMCGLDLPTTNSGREMEHFKAANPDSCAFYIPRTYYAVTWTDYEGGTCWVKRDVSRFHATVNPGAVSFIRDGVIAAYLEIRQLPNMDIPGYDVGSTKAYGWQYDKCLVDCNAHPKCFAVTWTDFEGGTCWLKNRANTPVARPGAVSSFLAKSTTFLGSCPRL